MAKDESASCIFLHNCNFLKYLKSTLWKSLKNQILRFFSSIIWKLQNLWIQKYIYLFYSNSITEQNWNIRCHLSKSSKEAKSSKRPPTNWSFLWRNARFGWIMITELPALVFVLFAWYRWVSSTPFQVPFHVLVHFRNRGISSTIICKWSVQKTFQQHFSIFSKSVCYGFYLIRNVAFTLISFAVLNWDDYLSVQLPFELRFRHWFSCFKW